MGNLKVALFIVDPNNDFVVKQEMLKMQHPKFGAIEVPTGHEGALYVQGAEANADNIVAMMERLDSRLDDVFVSLDAHQEMDQAHTTWWYRLKDGATCAPFTILGRSPDGKRVIKWEVDATGKFIPTDEEYMTFNPSFIREGGCTGHGFLGYDEALAAKGKFKHVVWPVHCTIGSWGQSVYEPLRKALGQWAIQNKSTINWIAKGTDIFTEHYSALEAEVFDPREPAMTGVNTNIIQAAMQYDILALSGWALSHCLANTGDSLIRLFADPAQGGDPRFVEKLVLLEDATSNVPGFEFLGSAFIDRAVKAGMKISNTRDFLR